jgi:probable DNA metabolism protein
MMTTLIYDGTFEGLLTAVFEVYDRRLDRVNLQKSDLGANALFEDKLQVITDEARANRVLKGLKQKVSSTGVQRLYAAHLAEMDSDANTLLGYIRYAFDSAMNIEEILATGLCCAYQRWYVWLGAKNIGWRPLCVSRN